MITEFNQRITIQKGELASDFFQESRSFFDFYSCFSQLREKSLSENVRDGNTTQDETLEFTIRSCQKSKELNSIDYRILFRGRIYDIVAIDHDKFTNRIIRITARRCGYEHPDAAKGS